MEKFKDSFIHKKRKIFTIFIMLILITFIFIIFSNQAFGLEWKKYESENFIVFYPVNLEFQARESMYFLEKERPDVKQLTANKIEGKIPVVIEDRGQFTNGFADPINNKVGIFTYQPGSYSSLSGYENWFRLLNTHELTHMGHMTNTSGLSSLYQFLYGNLYSPNFHSPLWLIEGTAVYSESQLSPHSGRLNGGYYDAVYGAKAAKGDLPSLAEITYTHNHFPSGHQYLYGAKFVDYLNDEYGEDKLANLFSNYGSYFWAPFLGDIFPGIGLDLAARKVYGSNISSLYKEWQEQAEEENKDWEIKAKKVLKTNNAYISNLTSNNNKLYYFKSDIMQSSPYEYKSINKLVEYDLLQNKEKVLEKSLANNFGTIEIKGNKLYFLLSDVKKGFSNLSDSSFGTFSTLYSYDLENQEKEKIVKDEIRDFTVTESGEVLYAITNKDEFGSILISYKDGEKEKLGEIPELITEIKRYKDEIIIVSKDRMSTWDINYLDYENLKTKKIVNTDYPEKMISINGNNLFYTANYDGSEAIYQYNLKTDQIKKLTKGNYAQNGVMAQGDIYFSSYHEKGMGIYKSKDMAEKYVIKEKNDDEKKEKFEINFADLNSEITNDNIGTENLGYLFKPGNRFLPFYAQGQDAIGYNSYQFSLSSHGGFDFYYQTKYLNPITLSLNSYLDEEGRNNELALSYPIFRSNNNGLSEVNTSLRTDLSKYFTVFDLRFSYPHHEIDLNLMYEIDNKAYRTEGIYDYIFNNGKLSLGAENYLDLNGQTDVREIAPQKEIDKASKYNIDFTHKLFEMRKGLWNPNIFIGDFYGRLFLDYIQSNDINYEQLSGGGELIFESGMGNWLQFAPRLGISRSKEKEKIYFGFESSY